MTDWIEWTGGECPVDRCDAVQVQLRGTLSIGRPRYAGDFDWQHIDDDSCQDIIAYRIVKDS